MKKLIVSLALFLFIGFPCSLSAQDNEAAIKEAIENIADAFISSDMTRLNSYLSNNFSISVASMPSANNYIDPIMRDGRGVKGIEFVSIEKIDEKGTWVNAIFDGLNNNERQTSIMLFDNENKLVFADHLDRLFGPGRYGKSEKVASFPFTLKDGSIVISLKLNDSPEPLNFLFDSGADGMATNKATAELLGLQITRNQRTQVVGGSMEIKLSTNNTVHLTDDFSLRNQNIAIFDETREGVDGLIGLNLAFNNILHVNFDSMEISLYTFGDYDHPEDGEIISIRRPSGVINLPLTLNLNGDKEYKGNFVFDTGAHYSIICFSQFVQQQGLLESGFKPVSYGTTVSMGHSTPVYHGTAKKLIITPTITYADIPITLQTSSSNQGGGGHSIAGSFGVDLIRNFNFTIDLLRKEVHLAPHSKSTSGSL